MTRAPIWGLLAEFDDPSALIAAAEHVRDAGYKRIDAHTPLPLEELPAALGIKPTILPFLVLCGGILGCVGGYFMQYYATNLAYPLNVGGRPMHSWPMFVPITFELTVLLGGLTAVLGMLGLNGLPMPYHPLFNVPRFALATRDRFFLSVEARDRLFDRHETARLLRELGAREVSEVAR
jgi:Protein of unknown function (DUF3341)